MDCRRLDEQDPAAVEARTDNEDYSDQPPPPTPPTRQPPFSPRPSPPAPSDPGFRSRDAAPDAVSEPVDEVPSAVHVSIIL